MDYFGLGRHIELEDLGLSSFQSGMVKELLPKKQGLVVVCGDESTPKVIAVHTLITELMAHHRNIISIENTIWKEIRGVHQLQARSDIGISPVAAFRASMRQDPDVIILSMPIDSHEMLEICLQASLTGYFVVAVVTANSSMDCLHKMMSMCSNSYLLAKGLELILMQKSLPKLCNHCKQSYEIDEKIVQEQRLSFKHAFRRNISGCDRCHGEGRYGEEFIAEVLKIKSSFRTRIADGDFESELRKIIDDPAYESLKSLALTKASQGDIDLNDVLSGSWGDFSK